MENRQTSAGAGWTGEIRQSRKYTAPAKIPSAANNSEGCGPELPKAIGSGGRRRAAAASIAAAVIVAVTATSAAYAPIPSATKIRRAGGSARASIIACLDTR